MSLQIKTCQRWTFSRSEEDLGGFEVDGRNGSTPEGRKEAELKELVSGLSRLSLTDAQALSLVAIVQEKSPSIRDAWCESVARPKRDRAKVLSTLRDEASAEKDGVRELSRELRVQEQQTSQAEAAMREQRAALEQARGSFQELQAQLAAKGQEIQMKDEEPSEQAEPSTQGSGAAAPSAELRTSLLRRQVSNPQNELADTKSILKRQRRKNNRLWMKKHRTKLEALIATKTVLQRELGKVQELQARLAVKDQEIRMVQTSLETRTKELGEQMVLLAQRSRPSPADGAGSEDTRGEKERVDGAAHGREVRELKVLLTELQTILASDMRSGFTAN